MAFHVDRFHFALKFLKRARFDLTHTLRTDAKLGGEIAQLHWIIGEASRFEDAPLARSEDVQSINQRVVTACGFFGLNESMFLIVLAVDEPILPFASAMVSRRSIE
jgi:hypothetical protein